MATIKLKNGSGAPLASDLVQGEPALDLTNKRLYTEDAGGAIIEVGTNPSSITTSSADIDGGSIDGTVIGGVSPAAVTTTSLVATTADIDGGSIDGTVIGGVTPAAVTTSSLVATTADINGGSIDGAVIGGVTPAAGSFTTFTSTGIDDNAASTAITIDSSQNVGIGTSSPDVFSRSYTGTITGISSASGETALMLNSSGTNVTALEMGRAGTRELMLYDTPTASQLFSLTSKPLAFGTASVERMRIDASGNVGIGVTNPSSYSANADNLVIGGEANVGMHFDSNSSSGNGGIYFSAQTAVRGILAYSHTDDAMQFFTNGTTERMRIDANGNVGIGTDSPSAQLEVTSSNDVLPTISPSTKAIFATDNTGSYSANISIIANATGNSEISFGDYSDENVGLITYHHSNDALAFVTATAEAMRIAASGNVGIGTDSPSSIPGFSKVVKLEDSSDASYVVSGGAHEADFGVSSSGGYLGTTTNAPMRFVTNSTEAMRLDASGNLLVGTTSGGGRIHAQAVGTSPAIVAKGASDCFQGRTTQTSGASYFAYWVYNGSAVGSITSTGSSTSYNTTSDYRLKENVIPLTGAIDRVKQLKPSRFNFITDADTTVDGFIAHEVQEVIPEAATGSKDAMKDEEYEVTPAVLDDDGNVVTEAVMGTRSVPDYQGIDQSKIVPLLVAAIQELEARLAAIESN